MDQLTHIQAMYEDKAIVTGSTIFPIRCSLREIVHYYSMRRNLQPDETLTRGRTFTITDGLLQPLRLAVQQMQTVSDALRAVASAGKPSYRVDPGQGFLALLESALSLEELQLAWVSITNRLANAQRIYTARYNEARLAQQTQRQESAREEHSGGRPPPGEQGRYTTKRRLSNADQVDRPSCSRTELADSDREAHQPVLSSRRPRKPPDKARANYTRDSYKISRVLHHGPSYLQHSVAFKDRLDVLPRNGQGLDILGKCEGHTPLARIGRGDDCGRDMRDAIIITPAKQLSSSCVDVRSLPRAGLLHLSELPHLPPTSPSPRLHTPRTSDWGSKTVHRTRLSALSCCDAGAMALYFVCVRQSYAGGLVEDARIGMLLSEVRSEWTLDQRDENETRRGVKHAAAAHHEGWMAPREAPAWLVRIYGVPNEERQAISDCVSFTFLPPPLADKNTKLTPHVPAMGTYARPASMRKHLAQTFLRNSDTGQRAIFNAQEMGPLLVKGLFEVRGERDDDSAHSLGVFDIDRTFERGSRLALQWWTIQLHAATELADFSAQAGRREHALQRQDGRAGSACREGLPDRREAQESPAMNFRAAAISVVCKSARASSRDFEAGRLYQPALLTSSKVRRMLARGLFDFARKDRSRLVLYLVPCHYRRPKSTGKISRSGRQHAALSQAPRALGHVLLTVAGGSRSNKVGISCDSDTWGRYRQREGPTEDHIDASPRPRTSAAMTYAPTRDRLIQVFSRDVATGRQTKQSNCANFDSRGAEFVWSYPELGGPCAAAPSASVRSKVRGVHGGQLCKLEPRRTLDCATVAHRERSLELPGAHAPSRRRFVSRAPRATHNDSSLSRQRWVIVHANSSSRTHNIAKSTGSRAASKWCSLARAKSLGRPVKSAGRNSSLAFPCGFEAGGRARKRERAMAESLREQLGRNNDLADNIGDGGSRARQEHVPSGFHRPELARRSRPRRRRALETDATGEFDSGGRSEQSRCATFASQGARRVLNGLRHLVSEHNRGSKQEHAPVEFHRPVWTSEVPKPGGRYASALSQIAQAKSFRFLEIGEAEETARVFAYELEAGGRIDRSRHATIASHVARPALECAPLDNLCTFGGDATSPPRPSDAGGRAMRFSCATLDSEDKQLGLQRDFSALGINLASQSWRASPRAFEDGGRSDQGEYAAFCLPRTRSGLKSDLLSVGNDFSSDAMHLPRVFNAGGGPMVIIRATSTPADVPLTPRQGRRDRGPSASEGHAVAAGHTPETASILRKTAVVDIRTRGENLVWGVGECQGSQSAAKSAIEMLEGKLPKPFVDLQKFRGCDSAAQEQFDVQCLEQLDQPREIAPSGPTTPISRPVSRFALPTHPSNVRFAHHPAELRIPRLVPFSSAPAPYHDQSRASRPPFVAFLGLDTFLGPDRCGGHLGRSKFAARPQPTESTLRIGGLLGEVPPSSGEEGTTSPSRVISWQARPQQGRDEVQPQTRGHDKRLGGREEGTTSATREGSFRCLNSDNNPSASAAGARTKRARPMSAHRQEGARKGARVEVRHSETRR